MPAKPPPLRIWALLGAHRGDNNQVLALAEALGLPFEAKPLRYNRWRLFKPRLLGATLRSLDRKSRAQVTGEPPDLIISTGHRSVPVVRAIRRRSGGRTRAVHVGYPRVSPAHFDLVVTTPEYPVPDHANVLRIPFALARQREATHPNGAESPLLKEFPAPRRLLVLGGPPRYFRLREEDVLEGLASLLAAAAEDGGSILVVGSPRTPDDLLRAVERRLAEADVPAAVVPTEGPPSYRELLSIADMIFVTADSVSMVSEAVKSAKPVGLLPIRPTRMGAWYMSLMDRLRPGGRVFPRDLRFFWAALEQGRYAGTVAQPQSSAVPDFAAVIVKRVRTLLRQPAQPATAGRDSGRSAQPNRA